MCPTMKRRPVIVLVFLCGCYWLIREQHILPKLSHTESGAAYTEVDDVSSFSAQNMFQQLASNIEEDTEDKEQAAATLRNAHTPTLPVTQTNTRIELKVAAGIEKPELDRLGAGVEGSHQSNNAQLIQIDSILTDAHDEDSDHIGTVADNLAVRAGATDELNADEIDTSPIKSSLPRTSIIHKYVLTFVGDVMIGDAGMQAARERFEAAEAAQKQARLENKELTTNKQPANAPDYGSDFVWDMDEPFSKVKTLLANSDYVVGNLEAPVTRRKHNYDSKHAFSYNMKPAVAEAIKRSGIDALGLSNNHFLDRGPKGVRDTLDNMGRVNMPLFGLGKTLRDAARPLLVKVATTKYDSRSDSQTSDGTEEQKVVGKRTPDSSVDTDSKSGRSAEHLSSGNFEDRARNDHDMLIEGEGTTGNDSFENPTVGVVGFSDLFCCGLRAGNTQVGWGVLQPEPEDTRLGMEQLVTSGATLKVAYVHWGKNYKPVNDYQKYQAKLLAEAGFDLIVGSAGSHTAQGFEYVNGVPVMYSVGNYVFQTRGRFGKIVTADGTRQQPYAMVLHALIDPGKGRFSGLKLDCIVIDNEIVQYTPRVCEPHEAAEFFPTLGKEVVHTEGEVSAIVTFPVGVV